MYVKCLMYKNFCYRLIEYRQKNVFTLLFKCENCYIKKLKKCFIVIKGKYGQLSNYINY